MAKKSKPSPTVVLHLRVDKKLLEFCNEKLEARDSNIETYLRLQIKALAMVKTLLGLKDRLNFGKYFGEIVEDVVRADPGYIGYCMRFQEEKGLGSKFAPSVHELYNDLLEADASEDDIPF